MRTLAGPDAEFVGEEFRGLLLRFRGRTAMSQRQLADRTGVHLRSVQAWESGASTPSTDRLQRLIRALLEAGAFTAERAEADAVALWSAAESDPRRQRPPFDARWFADQQVSASVSAPVDKPATAASAGLRAQSWGDAPDTRAFCGRTPEQERLRDVLLEGAARVVVISGMGGIGKTSLAARAAQGVSAGFRRVYWRSLRDAPSFGDWSAGAVDFLADHQRIAPEPDHARIDVLLELMRAERCLLVLDNLEVLIEPGHTDGRFRPESQAYEDFLQAAATRGHQSCVLVTSRDVPPSLVQSGAEVVELAGLGVDEAKSLLREAWLEGDERAWSDLVERYGGNPLALQLVADSIRQLFDGDIGTFTEQVPTGTLVGSIRRLLDSEFQRLSPIEIDVARLLALNREPMTFAEISTQLAQAGSRSVLLEAVEALRHRSLLQPAACRQGFALQSVVLEYVTDALADAVATEIRTGQLDLLVKWPLVRADTRDFIRRTQEVLIAQPVLERLSRAPGLEQQLLALVDRFRTRPSDEHGNGPGNIANLLRLLRGNLRGIDLSGLSLRHLYLQETEAQDADLSHATLASSILDDAFGTVGCVSTSPGGEYVAAGTLEGALRVWRTADRAVLLHVRGHAGAVWGLALSADGRVLVSSGIDGAVRLWDISTGQSADLLSHVPGGIANVSLSADDCVLAASGFDGTVRVWGVAERKLLRSFEGGGGPLYGLALDASGTCVAASARDGTVRVWDLRTGSLRQTIQAHHGPVWATALTGDGATLSSGGADGAVRVWSMATGRLLATLDGHVGAVRSVSIGADGRIVASGGFDGSVRLWELPGGRRIRTLQGHPGGVRGVALTSDGRTLVSGGFDAALRIWDAHTGARLMTFQGHLPGLRGTSLSADGRMVAASGPDATIRVWEARTGWLQSRLDGHTGGVRAIAASADMGLIASSGLDGSVRLWQAETGQCLGVLQAHTAGCLAVAVSGDGRLVASGALDGTVRVWDSASRRCLQVLEGHAGAVWGVATNTLGDLIASCGVDGTVRVWRADGSVPPLVLEGHHGGVRSVALGRDGARVVSGGDDATVRVWDARTGRLEATLEGHVAAVYGVAISADGGLACSGGFDHAVRLWDIQSGCPLDVLEGHEDAVYAVALDAAGKMIASCSLDGTVKLWDMRSGHKPQRTLQPDRRYERMDITGLDGITTAQRATLLALGADTQPGSAPRQVHHAPPASLRIAAPWRQGHA